MSGIQRITRSFCSPTGLVGCLILFGITLVPADANAATVAHRSCVCESGSGGCAPGEYFCCNFDDNNNNLGCGCLFLGGLWHDCTN